jgi:hypothetical protein
MSTLYEDTFDTLDNVTTIETAGTVTVVTDSGRTCIEVDHTAGGGSWAGSAFYTNAMGAGAADQVIYVDVKNSLNAGLSLLCPLTDTASVAFSGKGCIYDNVGVWRVWNGSGTAGGVAATDSAIWHNFRYTINSDGTFTLDVHVDDGTLQWEISSWTTIASTTVVNTFNYATATNLYFAADSFNLGAGNGTAPLLVDSLLVTDDGFPTFPSTGSMGNKLVKMGQG